MHEFKHQLTYERRGKPDTLLHWVTWANNFKFNRRRGQNVTVNLNESSSTHLCVWQTSWRSSCGLRTRQPVESKLLCTDKHFISRDLETWRCCKHLTLTVTHQRQRFVCFGVWTRRRIVCVRVSDLQWWNSAAAVNQCPNLHTAESLSLSLSVFHSFGLSLYLSVWSRAVFNSQFPSPSETQHSNPSCPSLCFSLFLLHLLPLFHSISHHPPPSANQPPSWELWIEFKSVELYCLPPPRYLPPPCLSLSLLSNFLQLFRIDYNCDLTPTPLCFIYINRFLLFLSCLLLDSLWDSALSLCSLLTKEKTAPSWLNVMRKPEGWFTTLTLLSLCSTNDSKGTVMTLWGYKNIQYFDPVIHFLSRCPFANIPCSSPTLSGSHSLISSTSTASCPPALIPVSGFPVTAPWSTPIWLVCLEPHITCCWPLHLNTCLMSLPSAHPAWS